ncbi:unnamed protein product [Clonostachys rosea]|uniref:Ig-like domain-containing protein n=1 Tax=Bionectria ochroleuca TaxID=29856 RepID=A0ABY6U3W5_BIOOC|nr:unnamed protein product [Clonostachys rosea]
MYLNTALVHIVSKYLSSNMLVFLHNPLWLIVVLCGAVLLYLVVQPWFSPQRHLPGPFLARITRLWLFKKVYHGTFPTTNIELHRKYGTCDPDACLGPIVRIAPNEYSIDDLSAAKTIYGSGKGFRKSSWYEGSGNPFGPRASMFVESDPHLHATFRRKIAAAYSMTNLVRLESFVDKCTEILGLRLDEFAKAGIRIDVSHWMQCYAFDVGERFGFLDMGEDIQGIMSSLTDYLLYCARVGIFPEWHRTLFRRQMKSSKLAGLAHIRKFAESQLEHKYNQTSTKGESDSSMPIDMITKFLRIHDQDPSKINKDEILSVGMMNVGAGSDTTSISLSSVLFNLIKYPQTLERLRLEIKEHESDDSISDPIRFSEAHNLPYLQAVLKEALRMHPATGLILGRVVPPGGTTLAGQYFDSGTVVGINSWVAHANQDVYGADANIFRPERWLEDSELVKRRESYFMTFGQGSRTCIGKNISMMEMSKVIPQIVRHYDLLPQTASGNPEWNTENVWFVKTRDFYCKVRKVSS